MRTLVIGCNHRSAPVEMRERIAFDEQTVPRALHGLRARFPESESVLISTCNRMELYIARPAQGHPRIDEAIGYLGEFHGIAPSEFAQALYSHQDIEAVRHLFRVVSALDSMVLGETQILAQARTAFETARATGTVGRVLGELFPRAFSVAKNVQSRTGIASGRLSVGSTAVDLARQIFSRFDDKIVMMVGAGKMGELTLTHLLDMKPRALWVTNRTDARAAALSDRLAARHGVVPRVIPFAGWIDALAEADIVISSTGAREPILTVAQFAGVPARRRYKPLLLIDIAVPRDIDPAVGEQEEVFLYNIDDLQTVVEQNLAQRREAIQQCELIIESSVVEFVQNQSRREVAPVIVELQKHFRQVGQAEFERILPKLQGMSEHDRQLVQEMLHRITQKLLHAPVQTLNDRGENGAARVYAETLRALFRLSDE